LGKTLILGNATVGISQSVFFHPRSLAGSRIRPTQKVR